MEQRLEENNVKNENNRKKEYLKGYRTNRRRINRIDDEVTELRELAASVKATDYSGMPHGSGNQKDLSDELARIDTLEKRLEKEREKCAESYISIEDVIKAVKNEDENDVLFYRYVKGLLVFLHLYCLLACHSSVCYMSNVQAAYYPGQMGVHLSRLE